MRSIYTSQISFSISFIIRKHSNILSSSHRCRNRFKPVPIVASQRGINLSNFLVRTKLRNPSQSNILAPSMLFISNEAAIVHAFTCISYIPKIPSFMFNGLTSYTFHSTDERRRITASTATLKTFKNLIYMI